MSIFKKAISVMLCLVLVSYNMVFYPLSYANNEKINTVVNIAASHKTQHAAKKPDENKPIKAYKEDANEYTRFIIKYKTDATDKEKNVKNKEVKAKLKLSKLNSIKKIRNSIEVFEISEKGKCRGIKIQA